MGAIYLRVRCADARFISLSWIAMKGSELMLRRYCPMCDEWGRWRSRECPKCGAALERADDAAAAKAAPYQWRLGDVFTDGTYRWKVDAIHGDKAVLRSCSTEWATTRLLTFNEWREGGRWQLV